VGLQAFSPYLVSVALKFGPPEYFSLMILGLFTLSFLAQKSLLKALLMAGVGVLLGTIGQDPITGEARFTFGMIELLDGVGIVPLVIGIFGVSEVLLHAEKPARQRAVLVRVTHLLPTLQDWIASRWAIVRGGVIGFFLGVLPGGGAILSSFVSYAVEKRLAKNPERFGHGAIEGVAAPESANNAAAGAAFIPMLALGIPANPIMAILLGALMIHGIAPGPLLMKQEPELFWGVIASMYIGNIMLLVLNLPLIGLWIKLLRVPHAILFPLILLFCVIGGYSESKSLMNVGLILFFGVLGYLLRKAGYEPAPLVLAFVMGPMLEMALRQSLIISQGSFGIFVSRPISTACLLIAAALLATSFVPGFRKKKELVVEE